MRILGISGSLRRDSHNTSLLRAAAMSLPSGVELELFDGVGDLPHYHADIDEDPAPEARPACSARSGRRRRSARSSRRSAPM
jgi:chromate reductase